MAKQPSKPDHLPELPDKPVDKVLDPLSRFMRIEAASGILLLVAAVAAVVLANSAWSEPFLAFWESPVGFRIGEFSSEHSLHHWINDGLMVLFFFVIGLEVKRELVLGELRKLRRAAMPFSAALGGMLVPAGIYVALQAGGKGAVGWGVPMATDIAFVVGCLALLGSRVPRGLRVLLLSLAIVDDIGAILVIAVGYTSELNWVALGLGCGGILLCPIVSRMGVRSVSIYAVIGVLTWFAFHESGVHATIAGVLLGAVTPAKKWISEQQAGEIVEQTGRYLNRESGAAESEKAGALQHARRAGREALSPLERLEMQLHPWVNFGILPIFALANAGVPMQISDFGHGVAVAVIAGLVVGKPLGVMLFSWLAAKTGLAELPDRVNWGMTLAGGMLCGIGFTMSIFMADLAFGSESELLNKAKVGVLAASLISAVTGMTMLVILTDRGSENST